VSDTTESDEETVELDLEGLRELRSEFVNALEERGLDEPEELVRESDGEFGFYAPVESSDDPQVWPTIGALYVVDLVLALGDSEETEE
jgi:hypothetical protein